MPQASAPDPEKASGRADAGGPLSDDDLRPLSTGFRHSHRRIQRGSYPRRFHTVLAELGDVTGSKVLDLGGAEGTMAALLHDQGAAKVILLDAQEERIAIARELHEGKFPIIEGNVLDHLDCLEDIDTIVCLRMLYHMGESVHPLFRAIEESGVRRILLQGRLDILRRPPKITAEGAGALTGPVLRTTDGMERLLGRYGFRVSHTRGGRYPIVVGTREPGA